MQAANEWQLWDAQGALDTALYEWRAGLELSGPPLTAEELRRVVAQLPLSRQNTPSGRLGATQSQDQGADDGAGTEGSQAQVEPIEELIRRSSLGAALAAPADPAGLDEAIEAGAVALVKTSEHRSWDDPPVPPGAVDGWRESYRRQATAVVRAAASHLRAAALNEAADETGRLIAGLLPASQWGDGYVHGVTAAEQMLRERAGREATT